MTLINCPKCGKQFSESADYCPHCGFPTSEITSSNEENGTIRADHSEINEEKVGDVYKKPSQVSMESLGNSTPGKNSRNKYLIGIIAAACLVIIGYFLINSQTQSNKSVSNKDGESYPTQGEFFGNSGGSQKMSSGTNPYVKEFYGASDVREYLDYKRFKSSQGTTLQLKTTELYVNGAIFGNQMEVASYNRNSAIVTFMVPSTGTRIRIKVLPSEGAIVDVYDGTYFYEQ